MMKYRINSEFCKIFAGLTYCLDVPTDSSGISTFVGSSSDC